MDNQSKTIIIAHSQQLQLQESSSKQESKESVQNNQLRRLPLAIGCFPVRSMIIASQYVRMYYDVVVTLLSNVTNSFYVMHPSLLQLASQQYSEAKINMLGFYIMLQVTARAIAKLLFLFLLQQRSTRAIRPPPSLA